MGWIRMLCSTNVDEIRGVGTGFEVVQPLPGPADHDKQNVHSLLLNSCFANSFGKATACFTLEKRGLGVEGGGLMVS